MHESVIPDSDRFGGGERRPALPLYHHETDERKAALDAYWAANTPKEARASYLLMRACGLE